jgi:membrane-associated protein
LLIFALHLHLHLLHHRGAAIDYVGLALTAVLSWVIGIGPGEPVLVAAGVFAAKHKLDIAPVVFWAWIGAAVGGIIGWLLGMKLGRRVLTTRGPLRTLRMNSVEHGERLFKRREIWAIVLTPPWVAGINRSHARVYIPTTIVSALLVWAAPIGLGSYFAGPPILDFANDAGLVLTIGLVLVVIAVVGGELIRRRRRRERECDEVGPGEPSVSD